jgi:hypothetical protein
MSRWCCADAENAIPLRADTSDGVYQGFACVAASDGPSLSRLPDLSYLICLRSGRTKFAIADLSRQCIFFVKTTDHSLKAP